MGLVESRVPKEGYSSVPHATCYPCCDREMLPPSKWREILVLPWTWGGLYNFPAQWSHGGNGTKGPVWAVSRPCCSSLLLEPSGIGGNRRKSTERKGGARLINSILSDCEICAKQKCFKAALNGNNGGKGWGRLYLFLLVRSLLS